ncbi:hypothetical protein P7C70_g3108, partial [Phenoliferia sp. Uapishka_3]
MGVPGLWKHLQPLPVPTTFSSCATPHFHPPHYGLRLGIDVSIWLIQLHHASRNNHYILEPVIERVFDRICNLLRSGVLPFFILDGPGRPNVKRAHRSLYGDGRLTALETRLLPLLDLLGLPWRRAPGEAEAELAAVLKRGELDAILTIIRYTSHLHPPSAPSSASSYPSSATPFAPTASTSSTASSSKALSQAANLRRISIFHTSDLTGAFGSAAFILIAILCGGDYGAGVLGLGPSTAIALAKAGLGDDLLAAEGDDEALSIWRNSVADELTNNTQRHLARKEPALGRRILALEDFPCPWVLASYTHPTISYGHPPPSWSKPIDARGLSLYALETLGWTEPARCKRLAKALWPALFVVELRRAAIEFGLRIPSPPLPISPLSHSYLISSIFDITDPLKTTTTSTDGVAAFGLQFNSAIFCRHAALPLASLTSSTPTSKPIKKPPIVWILRDFLVAEFNANQVVLQWEVGGRRQEVAKAQTAARRQAQVERRDIKRAEERNDTDGSARLLTPPASTTLIPSASTSRETQPAALPPWNARPFPISPLALKTSKKRDLGTLTLTSSDDEEVDVERLIKVTSQKKPRWSEPEGKGKQRYVEISD